MLQQRATLNAGYSPHDSLLTLPLRGHTSPSSTRLGIRHWPSMQQRANFDAGTVPMSEYFARDGANSAVRGHTGTNCSSATRPLHGHAAVAPPARCTWARFRASRFSSATVLQYICAVGGWPGLWRRASSRCCLDSILSMNPGIGNLF